MKKTLISIIIITTLVCALCTMANAESNSFHHEIGDITIIFDSASSFTEEEQTQLAQLITNHATGSTNNEVVSYNLMCTLFGHKYGSAELAYTTTHKVKDTAPRCKEECYSITQCTRCDHTELEIVNSSYINCCPED